MKDKQIAEMAMSAQNALKEAVHKELLKKAKLGQDAIIWRDGKTCRVKASELVSVEGK